ncbi:MAG TPA: hypothetical protein DCL54_10065 [Alphaproteobacteria bacterium]|nr:hypothetical protein [Alphaproteobacteria bacterium]HAJ46911.1 hypothetical protein [Alphaproteobacteria bacterium]
MSGPEQNSGSKSLLIGVAAAAIGIAGVFGVYSLWPSKKGEPGAPSTLSGSTETAPVGSGPAVDAALLKTRMTQIVETMTKASDTDVTVTADGEPTVESKDDGSVVATTPKLTIKSKEGESTELGAVVITFKRGSSADHIPFSVVLPSNFAAKDASGKTVAEAKLGGQTIEGVWRDDLQTVDQLNMKLTDFEVIPPEGKGSLKLGEMSMTGGLEDKGNGLYDGKYTGRMANFVLNDTEQKFDMKMAEIAIRANMGGARLKEYAAAAKEAGYTLSNPDIFKVWTSGKFDDKMIAFLRRMPEFFSSLDYGYSVKDISASENGKELFQLAKADVGFGLAADGADKAKAKMTFGFGGLKALGEDGQPVVPPEASINDSLVDVDVNGLPAREIWDIYMQMIANMPAVSFNNPLGNVSPEDQAKMDKMSEEAGVKLLESLQKSTLGINLNKADVMTPTVVMGGDGSATYTPSPTSLPVGKFAFRFSGIEALSDAMAKRGQNDPIAQQALAAIMGLKAIAKPDPNAAAGKPGYIIEVEMTKDGKVLANGQQLM